MISRSFQSSAEAYRTLLIPCLRCEWVDVSVFFFLWVMVMNGLVSSILLSESSLECVWDCSSCRFCSLVVAAAYEAYGGR